MRVTRAAVLAYLVGSLILRVKLVYYLHRKNNYRRPRLIGAGAFLSAGKHLNWQIIQSDKLQCGD